MMNTTAFLTFLISLLAITNPLGNLALFVGLTADRPVQEQRRIAKSSTVAIAIIMVLVTWLGDSLLKFFGISLPAFQTAGGIIIALISLSMLHSCKTEMSHSTAEHNAAQTKDSISVVPVAIPIFAGPGVITTLIIAAQNHPDVMSRLIISATDVAVAFFLGFLMFFSYQINKFIGPAGMKISTRIMGMILLAIAVGMITSGLSALLPGLK